MITIQKVNLLIETYKKKLETTDSLTKQDLEKELEISLSELSAYQNLKSLAQLKGLIDLDTAMLCYNSLNNWHTTKLETKITLTQLFAHLALGFRR